MHHSGIVFLKDRDGNILEYQFFYSFRKAKRAFNKAKKPDTDGHHELVGEDGEYFACSDVDAEIRFIGDYLSTSEHPSRRSFVNLSEKEVDELADALVVPPKIIRHLASDEMDFIEGTRPFGHTRFIPYFPSGVDFRCSEMWFLL